MKRLVPSIHREVDPKTRQAKDGPMFSVECPCGWRVGGLRSRVQAEAQVVGHQCRGV